MNSYILLRSNKETGPHSLADLEAIGLKSNDLIWIECQSVGWRNPGEINELKKLLTGNTTVNETLVTAVNVKEPETDQPLITKESPVQPIVKEQMVPVINHATKSSVFVSLPAGKSQNNYQQPVKKEMTPVKKELITEKKDPQPIYYKTEPVSTAPVEAKTKYSKSLDEIKELYVKNLEQRKVRPKFLPLLFSKHLKKAAVYAGLVLVGAATVLLLRNPAARVPTLGMQQSPLPAKLKLRPGTLANDAGETGAYSSTSGYQEEETVPVTTKQRPKVSTSNTAITEDKNSAEENVTEEEMQEKNDRISIPKGEVPEIYNDPTDVISGKVSVKNNSYTIAALGGIRNLELTLHNTSKFHLDKVTVELKYLNPSGSIIKSEELQFRSVQANGTQTIAVKKTNRGVKVTHKIVRIESKEVSEGTAGL